MIDLTFEQLISAKFELYDGNPVVHCPASSAILADPSVLTPDNSHDGKWHMFCHTIWGVNHYSSADGISFKNEGQILNRAMRADVNYINGLYFLYYERVQPLLPKALTFIGAKWFSEIYVVTSKDLVSWTKPKKVVGATKDYMTSRVGTSISNPFLIRINDKNRLYFSAGLTFIDDCGFSEPTYISFAESDGLTSGFAPIDTPVLSPDKDCEYLNLCCGCIKVYQLKDCFVAFQNGIYKGDDGKSHSAIVLLKSQDGKKFEFVKYFLTPQVCENLGKNKNWMQQYVYACSLSYYDGNLNLYFNARNVSNPIKGREHIGLYRARI